jgi:hypothetical protein
LRIHRRHLYLLGKPKSVEMPENAQIIRKDNIVGVRWKYPNTGPNRALGYKVKHASGFLRTYKWDKMTELFVDAEIRMNEYWPNAKVKWQGKLNIQQHIAIVNDYDNSVIKTMIDLLDEKDRTVIAPSSCSTRLNSTIWV